jgi:hypothetical protein
MHRAQQQQHGSMALNARVLCRCGGDGRAAQPTPNVVPRLRLIDAPSSRLDPKEAAAAATRKLLVLDIVATRRCRVRLCVPRGGDAPSVHRSDAAVFSTAASTGTVARKRSAHCKAMVAKIAPDGVSAEAGDHLSDARLELAAGATPGSVGRPLRSTSDLLDGSASTPPAHLEPHRTHDLRKNKTSCVEKVWIEGFTSLWAAQRRAPNVSSLRA